MLFTCEHGGRKMQNLLARNLRLQRLCSAQNRAVMGVIFPLKRARRTIATAGSATTNVVTSGMPWPLRLFLDAEVDDAHS